MSNRNVMTIAQLKELYPNVGLMEGYDSAVVGIVPSTDNGCVVVYDSMKVISLLVNHKFYSQEELITHFNAMVSSAQKNSKVGPLFMQMVAIKPEYDDMASWIEADDSDSDSDYEVEYEDDEEDDEEGSDSEESDWHIDHGLEGEEGEEGEDGEYEDEYDDDDPDAPYMEIIVDIGTNNPKECQITRSTENIKDAISLIFPNLPRLDMVSKARFQLRNLEDME